VARILIIDDDDHILKALHQMLEIEGHKVIDASNGKEGLKLFRENGADLVITDILMPEKQGLEMIEELRRDFPHVKIIAMSGGGRVGPYDYLDMARKSGALLTLTKPFDREELLEAVNAVLE
jgi:YesN/AraC family two-component response regulator